MKQGPKANKAKFLSLVKRLTKQQESDQKAKRDKRRLLRKVNRAVNLLHKAQGSKGYVVIYRTTLTDLDWIRSGDLAKMFFGGHRNLSICLNNGLNFVPNAFSPKSGTSMSDLDLKALEWILERLEIQLLN